MLIHIFSVLIKKQSQSSSQGIQHQGPIQRLPNCFTDLRGQLSSQFEITACLNQWNTSHNPASFFRFNSSALTSLFFRSPLKKPQLVPLGFLITRNGTEHCKVNRISLWCDREGYDEVSYPIMLSRSSKCPTVMSITSNQPPLQKDGPLPWFKSPNSKNFETPPEPLIYCYS